MVKSLSNKLFSLLISCTLFIVLIALVMASINAKQAQTSQRIDQLIDIQLSVEALRSHLWSYVQHQNASDIEAVINSQKNLNQQLINSTTLYSYTKSLIKMNQELATLISQEYIDVHKAASPGQHLNSKRKLTLKRHKSKPEVSAIIMMWRKP